VRVEFTIEDDVHGTTPGKRYTPRPDCEECQGETYERVVEAGLKVHGEYESGNGGYYMINGQRFNVIYPPPADAKEWECPRCGGDVLYCTCNR
jgi:hypothetical protein